MMTDGEIDAAMFDVAAVNAQHERKRKGREGGSGMDTRKKARKGGTRRCYNRPSSGQPGQTGVWEGVRREPKDTISRLAGFAWNMQAVVGRRLGTSGGSFHQQVQFRSGTPSQPQLGGCKRRGEASWGTETEICPWSKVLEVQDAISGELPTESRDRASPGEVLPIRRGMIVHSSYQQALRRQI